MKKIVITGALGHIGSRLIREVPRVWPEVEIVMIDNLATQRYSSLFDLPAGTFRFIEENILTADLPKLFAGADAVIHLAAITTAADSFALREIVERDNLFGTQRVADACSAAGAALFFPSTSSVYGTTKESVDESAGPEDLQPQSPYAATKLKEEAYLLELAAKGKLRVAMARFGTIFGISPGMRFHTAVNKFCWQAVMKQPITVWETALDQKRPYLDLSDAVNVIVHLLRHQLFSGLYNAVTVNTTVRDIVGHIQQRLSHSEVRLVKAEIMNSLSYDVSTNKLMETGFLYRGSLHHGINETIDLLTNAHTTA